MDVSRRGFVAGVLGASSVALTSGCWGEVFAAEGERVVKSQVARILYNENPLGPSAMARDAIVAAMGEMNRYSVTESRLLEAALRKRYGLGAGDSLSSLALKSEIDPNATHGLILGSGSTEILRAAAWAYCTKDGSVVEAHPGYTGLGSTAAEVPGVKIERRLVPVGAGNKIDVKGMIQAIDASTRVVVICNPNNPTGTTITLNEIEKIAEAMPADGLVFVDEAYIEYLGDRAHAMTAMEMAKSKSNVLVARTFSKIYGLAGLRVGYAVASEKVLRLLRPRMLGVMGLNVAGIAAARATLDDQKHIAESIALKHRAHEVWERASSLMGWELTASDANFGWIKVNGNAGEIVSALKKRGVLIGSGERWELPGYIRVSVGTDEENEMFYGAVRGMRGA